FEHERRLMAANLEDAARALATCRVMAETGVEKARVMHAELAHHRKIGRHFGGVVRRDRHRLTRDENIKHAGIEDDAAILTMDLFPEIPRRVMADQVKVDYSGMGFGAVAGERAFGRAQIDAKA